MHALKPNNLKKRTMTNSQKPNYTFALTVMVVLMFLLGFITTMNNSMIAFCN